MQSTQEKELHSALKKNYSVLQNALKLAQIEEGLMGDNTAIFTPSSSNERHYESAKKLAKYLNVIKVCKNGYGKDCSEAYYPIKYATNKPDTGGSKDYAAVVLTDGSIYQISQHEECSETVTECKVDGAGNCLKDENGNVIQGEWNRTYCASVYIDVNGAKGPNKYGKDNFVFSVYPSSIQVNSYGPTGGKKGINIFTNKI